MEYYMLIKNDVCGNSLVVQWLGLCAFTAEAQVRSLIGELIPQAMWCSQKKKGMWFVNI